MTSDEFIHYLEEGVYTPEPHLHDSRIFIIEGVDCAGKSSLIEKIKLNLQYVTHIQDLAQTVDPSQKDRRELENKLLNLDRFEIDLIIHNVIKQINGYVLLDRCFPSEYVYSRLFDRKLHDKQTFALDKLYSYCNATIVYCKRQKFDEKLYKDKYIDVKDIAKLEEYYEQFFKGTNCKVVRVHT